jgi:predicted peptidase
MKAAINFFILILILCSFPGISKAQNQTVEKVRFRKKAEVNYLLSLPADYHKKRKAVYPLMIFLHGSGERGNNLELVKKWGPPAIVDAGKDLPFIVVSPQCPENQWWNIDDLDGWLTMILKKYRIDTDRVYLTGLSMGGFGTWEWACYHPDRFAAIAPVCGGGNTHLVENIIKIPVWAFHGEIDPVVPVSGTRDMVHAVNQAGGKARMTIYPDTGHDSWIQAYNDENLYLWFLSQNRKNNK